MLQKITKTKLPGSKMTYGRNSESEVPVLTFTDRKQVRDVI